MRVIQGQFKGYRFPEYKGENTRPTSDLVKESLMQILESMLNWEQTRVADLFAGTGNIGVECLSRGAAELISVDHDLRNIRYMQQVKRALGSDNWTIVRSDALVFLKGISRAPDLLFADPPYDYPHVHELLNLVRNAVWFKKGNTLFVLEHTDRLVFPDNDVLLKRKYGNTVFTCFRYNAQQS